MIPLLAFLPAWLTWRVLGYLAVAAALSGTAYKFVQHAKDSAYHEGQVVQLELDKKSFAADRQEYDQKVKAADQRTDRAIAALGTANLAIQAAAVSLQNAKQAQLNAHASVDKVPDAGLLLDLRRKLGVRPPQDPYLGLYPEELRRADEIVTETDAIKRQIDAHEAHDRATDDKIHALEEQMGATIDKLQAAIDYGNDVTVLYAKAYNAAQPRVTALKKIVTINCLFRGCQKKLDLPEPHTLKPPVPAGKEPIK